MISLEAKFQSILLRYGEVIEKSEDIEYRAGVQEGNFNIVAVGNEKKAPMFFKQVIKTYKEFKDIVKNYKSIMENIALKKIYEF